MPHVLPGPDLPKLPLILNSRFYFPKNAGSMTSGGWSRYIYTDTLVQRQAHINDIRVGPRPTDGMSVAPENRKAVTASNTWTKMNVYRASCGLCPLQSFG